MIPATATIRLSFEFSEEFLVEAMSRQRRVKRSALKLVLFKLVPAAFMIPIALVMIFKLDSPGVGSFLVALTGFMFVAHHVDFWIAKRRLRRSAHHRDLVQWQFSPEQVQVVSRTTNATFQWAAFTGAAILPDGVLLYQGETDYNWLPVRCLENSGQSRDFFELVRQSLGDRVFPQ